MGRKSCRPIELIEKGNQAIRGAINCGKSLMNVCCTKLANLAGFADKIRATILILYLLLIPLLLQNSQD